MLPLFFDLREQPCLVVGGGGVAARKVRKLLAVAARVTVVAPQLCPQLAQQAAAGLLHHRPGRFRPSDLEEALLVIAATDDEAVNAEVSRLCRKRRLPVNVVDRPALCSVTMGSIVARPPLLLAIGTAGAAPLLARHLRRRLEGLLPSAYGRLAVLMRRYRPLVRERIPDATLRRRFWEQVVEGPISELLFSGREQASEALLQQALEDSTAPLPTGEVYLVGGGPGDPDLLTLRALRLMQQADVVLYDRLIASPIVDLCRHDAERVYVGKGQERHAMSQKEINHLMVQLARKGQRVLRLKGGDPFFFGRGGEEIDTLAQEGIPFQVVPGITAAAGCASYAGIPLTHREYAHSCLFVTGHMKDGALDLNWEAILQPRQTVAVYMGVLALEPLCAELRRRGMPDNTPAALVQQGTTPRQRVFTGTIADLPDQVAQNKVRPPSMIFIGEVVRLRSRLAWVQENLPQDDSSPGHSKPENPKN